jgi:glycosyltransferase involved in cell wall biosynthesis
MWFHGIEESLKYKRVMKILHISYSDNNGAGLCALRIHKSMLDAGVDSKMLVANKSSNLPSVFVAEESDLNRYSPPKNKLLRKTKKLLRKRGNCLTTLERYQIKTACLEGKAFYTFPLSHFRLDKHPLVEEADVLHLHWVANYVDYPTFFPNIDKPIVWTFHDENIGMGVFHYQRDKAKYGHLCKDTEEEIFGVKQQALKEFHGKLRVIAISNQMQRYLSNIPIIGNCPITIINNSVDSSVFRPVVDKETAKQVFGIPKHNLVFAFCSVSLKDERKGLKELIAALERLNREDMTLICAGGGNLPVETKLNVIQTGVLGNERLLSLFYSCADYFVMPSFQEAFAQTPLEAMACGVPVVAFPCSGTEELIAKINGVRCDDFTVNSLYNGIKCAMDSQYNSKEIRQDMIDRFSPEKIASQYLDNYKEMLD